jgi:predicted ribosome quality control (RQC) complex YloA/Tae2 family protein
VVRLDPALAPRENMERYYRRYRRIADSAARVEARRREVEGRLAELLRLLDALDGAALDELPRLEREARRLGAPPRPAPRPRSRRDEPAPPYRAYRSAANLALLVGRNAADNDALTLKVARGNDAWLHARGITGAHVVIRLDKGKAPDQETLLDAAHLAAWFSDARGEPSCEVVWTRAKYVRKPRAPRPARSPTARSARSSCASSPAGPSGSSRPRRSEARRSPCRAPARSIDTQADLRRRGQLADDLVQHGASPRRRSALPAPFRRPRFGVKA